MPERGAVDRLPDLGWSTAPSRLTFDRDRLRRYAEVTGQGRAEARAGLVGVPTVAMVAAWRPMLAVLGEVRPPAALAHVLHARHALTLHGPIRPDEVLDTVATFAGCQSYFGSLALQLHARSRRLDGSVAFAQDLLLALPGVAPRPSTGELPARRIGGPEPTDRAEVRIDVPASFSRSFAEVSGDDLAIHVDEDAARAAGFETTIVQGMGALALTIGAVTTRFDVALDTVHRLEARFERPLLSGEPLDVDVRAAADGPDEWLTFTANSRSHPTLRGTLGIRK